MAAQSQACTERSKTETKTDEFQSFQEFYPYYLSEHRNPTCRTLHYIGTSLGLGVMLFALTSGNFSYLPTYQ